MDIYFIIWIIIKSCYWEHFHLWMYIHIKFCKFIYVWAFPYFLGLKDAPGLSCILISYSYNSHVSKDPWFLLLDNGIRNKHMLIVSTVSLYLSPHRRHGKCLRQYSQKYSIIKDFTVLNSPKLHVFIHSHELMSPWQAPKFSLSP